MNSQFKDDDPRSVAEVLVKRCTASALVLCPCCKKSNMTVPPVCDVSVCSQACSGPDVGLLVGAIIIAWAILWCVYCVIARHDRSKKLDSFAFVSIVCSQFVSLFQMLGVMQSLAVAWPEPFTTILELASVMNFRLEVLNVGCVVSAPPLHRYVANAFTVVVLVLCMVVCHCVHVMVFNFTRVRRPHFRQFMSPLFGAVGTVFMAVYISVCSAIVQPLQCDPHPNGLSTMRAYRQVTCWDDEGEHQKMMMIGALASLIPLAFLSMCAWVTVTLPKRLHAGDTHNSPKPTFLGSKQNNTCL